jgi:hypothetical protein
MFSAFKWSQNAAEMGQRLEMAQNSNYPENSSKSYTPYYRIWESFNQFEHTVGEYSAVHFPFHLFVRCTYGSVSSY